MARTKRIVPDTDAGEAMLIAVQVRLWTALVAARAARAEAGKGKLAAALDHAIVTLAEAEAICSDLLHREGIA